MKNYFRIYKYRNPETQKRNRIIRCDYQKCDKIFNVSFRFEHHYRMHTGERLFGCPFETQTGCKVRFTIRRNVNSHLIVHTGTETVCPVCQKMFKNVRIMKVSYHPPDCSFRPTIRNST